MKILVVSPYYRDANSFWRGVGPMNYLSKFSNGEIVCETPVPNTQLAWDTITKYDVVFLHRPCRKDDMTIMQMAHSANIPVWIDYDDWLFELPEWNPHQDSYHNKNLQILMSHFLACADVVTVSTEALMQGLSKVSDKVIICPNAYRSDLFPFRAQGLPDRKINFVWRGTNTHDGDLLSVDISKLPDKLYVFGNLPYLVKKNMEMNQRKYELIPHQDVLVYWHKIYEVAPKFMVYPLKDCYFNRCKSNIAWMEAIHAGALAIAPDLPEWRQPGVLTYTPDDTESFQSVVDSVSKMTEEERSNQVKLGYEHIKSKYDISVINQIRIKILEALMSPSFKKNPKSPFDQGAALWAYSKLKS